MGTKIAERRLMPLRRHDALRSLSREHHLALQLARGLQRSASPTLRAQLPQSPRALAAHVRRVFREELARHFAAEDLVIAPAIAGKDAELDRLSDELALEHSQLRACVDALDAPGVDDAQRAVILARFGTRLEAHVRKEERSFYQRLQEVLDEPTLEGIGAALRRYAV